MSRINTINDHDLLSLGIQHNAPALTPSRHPEKIFNLESSRTHNRLVGASQKLSTLPILAANDVIETLESCPTPVRDEPIYLPPDHHTHANPHTTTSPLSVSSSSSSDSSSDSDTRSSTSSSGTTLNKDQPSKMDASTMTRPPSDMIKHISTNTDITTIDNETQTHNQYLSANSILRTERYKVDYNVLRALTHMMNDLDTNLALDFAQLINRNI